MNNIPQNVQQVLTRVPGWSGSRELKVEPIGGLTNTNYRVTTNNEQFALRISGLNTARLGIDRECEYNALITASTAGLAPEVIAFLKPEGHLVTRWVEGRHWDADEFRTPANVRLLTETVKRIHTLPANGAVFSPFQRVELFLETAIHYGVPLPSNLESILATQSLVQQNQSEDHTNWQRLCHNDLVCVNYLFDPAERKIKILDWEFAGSGDLYYDLATIVFTHDSEGPIPLDLEEVMLECYFGIVTDLQRQRLRGMKFMLMLFTGAWGLAQHGMLLAGLIPPVEDFNYLEFAQTLFTQDIPQLEADYFKTR